MAEVISKIGQTMVEKALTESQKSPAVTQGDSDFARLLNEKLDQTDRSGGLREQILQAFGMSQENAPVQAISAEGLEIDPSRIAASQEIRSQGKVLDLLTDVNRGALQMDSMIDLVGSGRNMSPQSLLAVQATLSVNVLQMELTKSIFEQVNTGTKTLLNTSFA